MSWQLQATAVPHALIDTDELDRVNPVPADLPRITEQNLASVWRTFSERGIDRLILVGVYLTRSSELEWIARAIPEAQFSLVRLQVSEDTLFERVRQREIGSGLPDQWQRTQTQAAAHQVESSPGVHDLSTDGASVIETAERILQLWIPRGRRGD